MERRQALKYTALMTGAAVGAPLVSALLSGCKLDNAGADGQELKFFPKSEFELLMDVIDVILPRTESPSASDAGVHYIIDNMIGHVYNDEDRAKFRDGFKAFTTHLRDEKFLDATGEDRLTILQDCGSSDDSTIKEAYLDLRQQTIAYYLTTQPVATEFLNFLPVPGVYEPCIQLTDVGGKAWAI